MYLTACAIDGFSVPTSQTPECSILCRVKPNTLWQEAVTSLLSTFDVHQCNYSSGAINWPSVIRFSEPALNERSGVIYVHIYVYMDWKDMCIQRRFYCNFHNNSPWMTLTRSTTIHWKRIGLHSDDVIFRYTQKHTVQRRGPMITGKNSPIRTVSGWI